MNKIRMMVLGGLFIFTGCYGVQERSCPAAKVVGGEVCTCGSADKYSEKCTCKE